MIGDEFRVNTTTGGLQEDQSITTLSDGSFVVIWQSFTNNYFQTYGQRYAANGTPIGTEFDVNPAPVSPLSIDSEYSPEVVALSGGGFVVTWDLNRQIYNPATDFYDWEYLVQGRVYAADGTPAGAVFQVNTFADGQQGIPQTTGLSGGGFVVTWVSGGQDGSSAGVYGQLYAANGAAVGSEFQVNTYTTNAQNTQQITALSNGGFVVTWSSAGQDGSFSGIYGQRYAADGTAAGVEFRVNTITTDSQFGQQVTALSSGGFVVTWMSIYQDGDHYGIFGQRYAADGSAAGTEFQVNTYTTGQQSDQQITALNDGGFVVTWMSNWQDGSIYGVFAQRYAADGSAAGSEFQVNTYTIDKQDNPQITALSDGGFVVTWVSAVQDALSNSNIANDGVYGQRYAADGTPVGTEFLINTFTTGHQNAQQVTALIGGGFVVTWVSSEQSLNYNGQDGSHSGVYGRVFNGVAPTNGNVTITGTSQQGETLTADASALMAEANILGALSYQWVRDGVFVSGETDATYVLTAADVGAVVTVIVHYQSYIGFEEFVQSAPTAPIDDGNTDPTGSVSLAGNADVGFTLTADVSLLDDPDTLGALSYQWFRGRAEVVGETGATYDVTAADIGQRMRVVVSYQDGAGFDEAVSSTSVRIAGFTGVDLLGAPGNANDTLIGSAFEDRLRGRGGDDLLIGSNGRDILQGGGDNDTLFGGGGNDVLRGDEGDDALFGDVGRDMFIFTANSGHDTIHDYEDGRDFLRFAGLAANIGDLNFTQNGTSVDITIGGVPLPPGGAGAALASGAVIVTVLNSLVADFDAGDFMF